MWQGPPSRKIDWATVLLFLVLALSGWLNIYAAEYDPEAGRSIFDLSTSAGRQLLWIGTSLVVARVAFFFDFRFFDSFAFFFYGFSIALLLIVLLVGREVAGSRSWLDIRGFGMQPSELAKFTTALALAKYLAPSGRKLSAINTLIMGLLIISVPLMLTAFQGDTGTAIVFVSLLIPMFREGMPSILLISALGAAAIFLLTLLVNQIILLVIILVAALLAMGLHARSAKKLVRTILMTTLVIGGVQSSDYVLNDVLKPHQQKRILSLISPDIDPLGAGWNVTQSKIAIGSGGLYGKGFLQGTQTKFDFVPEQTTDFIFCTIGEEQGWIGSTLLFALFTTLFLRLVFLAERQKSPFARILGYGVVGVLFFHFAVNIAMTMGLFPVIGIPLPFFSYGGSSLCVFALFLFVFLKLDAHRMEVLKR